MNKNCCFHFPKSSKCDLCLVWENADVNKLKCNLMELLNNLRSNCMCWSVELVFSVYCRSVLAWFYAPQCHDCINLSATQAHLVQCSAV